MNRYLQRWLFALLPMFAGTWLRAATLDDRVALTHQHVDLRIVYQPGTTNELFLAAHDADRATNYVSTNVVLVARESSATTIPPGFEVFGEAGSPFWILPASQNPELLYLGVSAEGLPRGTFVEPLTVRLIAVSAPSWFFVWQFDPGGELDIKMNSRDGIGPEDVIQPNVGSHAHFNWGFSSNGWYAVTFRVEGQLIGASTNLTAADTTFLFAVEPLPPDPPLPATLTQVAVVGDQLTCQLTGTPGTSYQIQTTSNLINWIEGPMILAKPQPVPVTVPLPTGTQPLFIRALSP